MAIHRRGSATHSRTTFAQAEGLDGNRRISASLPARWERPNVADISWNCLGFHQALRRS